MNENIDKVKMSLRDLIPKFLTFDETSCEPPFESVIASNYIINSTMIRVFDMILSMKVNKNIPMHIYQMIIGKINDLTHMSFIKYEEILPDTDWSTSPEPV